MLNKTNCCRMVCCCLNVFRDRKFGKVMKQITIELGSSTRSNASGCSETSYLMVQEVFGNGLIVNVKNGYCFWLLLKWCATIRKSNDMYIYSYNTNGGFTNNQTYRWVDKSSSWKVPHRDSGGDHGCYLGRTVILDNKIQNKIFRLCTDSRAAVVTLPRQPNIC